MIHPLGHLSSQSPARPLPSSCPLPAVYFCFSRTTVGKRKVDTSLGPHIPHVPNLPGRPTDPNACTDQSKNWTKDHSSLIQTKASFLRPTSGKNSRLNPALMPDSLSGERLQGIVVVVFIKPCARLRNNEYNYRDSLQARAIEGIRH